MLKVQIFGHFLIWEGVMVLKGLIFSNFHLGRMWWSWKYLFCVIFTWEGMVFWKDWYGEISTLGGCVSLEITDFGYFLHGMIWWCWKDWFLSVFSLIGCGRLERSDFRLLADMVKITVYRIANYYLSVFVCECLQTAIHARVFSLIGHWLTQLIHQVASSLF